MSRIRKNLIIAVFLVIASFVVVNFSLAQSVDTGMTFGQQIGLSDTDPRIVIANVIRIALGFLGIIAVGLIIYAGWLYMTAAGEEDKIEKAKKILVSAIIGLVIILSAFAIATFIMSRMLEATGGTSTTPSVVPSVIPPGGGAPDQFYVNSTSPSNGSINVIRNAKIRFQFNKDIKPATVNIDNFKVKDGTGASIAGTSVVTGGMIEFTPAGGTCPTNTCGATNCFADGAKVTAEAVATGGILSVDNKTVNCGIRACSITFDVGNVIDCEDPTVSLYFDNGQVCVGDTNIIIANANDISSGISHVKFFANPASSPETEIDDLPPPGPYSVNWDGSGYTAGQSVVFKATAYDLDDHNKSDAKTVNLRPEHCCNGATDGDETGIDCGGADCANCEGAACATDINSPGSSCNNNLCTSGFCTSGGSNAENCAVAGYKLNPASCCLCQNAPRIDWISPIDGAVGGFVTIGGKYFGDTAGKVYFWDGSAYTKEAQFPGSVNTNCGNTWKDDQIIVVVPAGAVSGPIKVKVAGTSGYEDDTANARGILADFAVNTTVRPGICGLSPDHGIINETINYQGINLLNSTAYFGSMLNKISALGSSFSATGGTAKVPNIGTGQTTGFVLSGTEYSNYLKFTEDPEPYVGPKITSFEPDKGAPGQYVTIRGSGFGRTKGTSKVSFGISPATEANYDFPEICADSVWGDNQVIVKVPSGSMTGIITVTIGGQSINSSKQFTVNSDPLTPSLCKMDPTMGSNNSPISLWGENFGVKAADSSVNFYSDKKQTGADIISWEMDNSASGAIKPYKIVTEVHQEAQTGPVQVVRGALVGNGLNFTVGSCAKDSDCGSGVCCPADSSEAGRCKAGADINVCYTGGSSVYEWKFSTGETAPIIPPTYYSCLGISLVTGKCDPLTCPNSPGTCSPYNNIAAGVNTCECCCKIGKAGECCASLTCEGNCGSDASGPDTDTYGYCSGCAAVGTTQTEHDAACNCEGASGKICDTSVGGGICKDCQQLFSGEECSKHATCCVDAKNGNICRGGTGDKDMVDYDNLAYCQYYQCAAGGNTCDSNPVASSTKSVYETSGECGIKCLQVSRPGEKCVNAENTACNFDFCKGDYSCRGSEDISDCGICCCNPNVTAGVPQTNVNGLRCVADKSPCDGGSRGLYCGCEKDQDCGLVEKAGCGSDTCCRARPTITGIYPDTTDVCLNTLITATFDQRMNVSSFSGNVVVVGDYADKVCPADTQYLSLRKDIPNKNIFAKAYEKIVGVFKKISGLFKGDSALAVETPNPTHNYCAVTGTVNGINKADGKTDLIFSLNRPLDKNRIYYVIIKGDEDFDSSKGVLSSWGIGFDGLNPDFIFNGKKYPKAKIWSFETGDKICQLDYINIDPVSYLFQTSKNDSGDDTPGDSFDTIADSDKFFQAKPYSSNGQAITAMPGFYNWKWDWSSDNTGVAKVSNSGSPDPIQIVTAENVKDGKTFIKAKAVITEDIINKPSTKDQTKTGQAEVYVFLCENPWPPIDEATGTWAPWNDKVNNCGSFVEGGCGHNYNYGLYYCRDAGADGPAGDLPAILSDKTIVRGANSLVCVGDTGSCSTLDAVCGTLGKCQYNILKEAYFFREALPDASGTLIAIPSTEGKKVELSWTSILLSGESPTGYRIYYGTEKGKYTKNIDAGTATSYIVEDLNNGQIYHFSVVAQYKSGVNSGYYEDVPATPGDTTAPAGTTAISAAPGDKSVAISWDNSGEAISFRVYYKASDTCDNFVDFGTSQSASKSPVNIPSLSNGTKYCFGLVAYDSDGNPSAMTAETTISSIPMAALAKPSAKVGNGKVDLTWGAVAGADKYRIYYRKASEAYGVPADESGTTHAVGSLVNDTAYYFAVKSVNAEGQESKYSPEVKATPVAIPTNFSATAGNRQVILNWTGAVGAENYNIYYKTDLAGDYIFFENVLGTNKTIPNLTNDTLYYFIIKSVNTDSQEGESSDVAMATPKATP